MTPRPPEALPRSRWAGSPAKWLPAIGGVVATVGVAPGWIKDRQIIDLDLTDRAIELRPGSHKAVTIVAQTVADLRRCVSVAEFLPAASEVVVAVVDCASRTMPAAFPIAVAGLLEARVLRGPGQEWGVRVVLGKPIPAGAVVTTVVRAFGRVVPLPVHRVGLAGPGAAHWRPCDPAAVPCLEEGADFSPDKQPATDLVLRMVGREPKPFADGRVKVVDRPRIDRLTWDSIGKPGLDPSVVDFLLAANPDDVPPIDEHAVNPVGFVSRGTTGLARLGQVGDGWRIHVPGGPRFAIHPTGAVTDADVARLRSVRAVKVEFGRHSGPIAAVRAIAGLACAGVPLFAREVPKWAAALGPELITLLTEVSGKDLDDDLFREVHSIRLRRAALRTHSTRARWLNIQRAAGQPSPHPRTVSVLLCTMRPEFVPNALAQIAAQRGVELELIVVKHGAFDHHGVDEALSSFDRPLTVLDVGGTAPFGAALNRGVDAASGDLVAKWDDDDWYGPEHLADLLLAHEYSGAELVGGGREIIYLEEIDLTVHQPTDRAEQFHRQVAGGSILVERSMLREVGGFRPLPQAIDTHLQRSVVAAGGRTYRTHGLGYVLNRRTSGHTWDVPVTYFLRADGTQWRGRHLGPLIDADRGWPGVARASGMTGVAR